MQLDNSQINLQNTEQNCWFKPKFAKPITNNMSERELLGYPESYVPTQFENNVFQDTASILGKSLAELTNIVENQHIPLNIRLAAGNLLAMVGDPRINTYNPEMVDIPGGDIYIGLEPEKVEYVFQMYRDLGIERTWIEKEVPRHQVFLRPYRLAKYPVTNLEYREFLKSTGATELPTSWEFGRFPVERSNHPVYSVTAQSSGAYAQWLSEKTGRKFRLPTEAEWEFSAGGFDGFEFPWGDNFEVDCANTGETGLLTTSPVGAFPRGKSIFGIFDLAGNVEEYVADNYSPYTGGNYIADHLIELHSTYRVARGGSFTRFRDLARTRRRHGRNELFKIYVMGFRLAEDII